MSALAVRSALSHEREAALSRALCHRDDDRGERIAAARQMISSGELDPDGILVAVRGERIVGAAIAAPLPARESALEPPNAADDDDEIADALVAGAIDWLAARGSRLVQCLLPADEWPRAAPLLRAGFRHAATLETLRHYLDLPATTLGAAERFRFTTLDRCGEAVFADIVNRTYEGSADCPELRATRTPADSLEAHRGVGFNPATWWLASQGETPLGVLIAFADDEGGWDLSYVGVVPEARRRGVGRELVRKALVDAKLAGQPYLSLAVDSRNEPARALYRQMGFEPYARRELLLHTFDHDEQR